MGFGRYLLKVLVGRLGRLVGMKVAHLKFISEYVDGEESTLNSNI